MRQGWGQQKDIPDKIFDILLLFYSLVLLLFICLPKPFRLVQGFSEELLT